MNRICFIYLILFITQFDPFKCDDPEEPTAGGGGGGEEPATTEPTTGPAATEPSNEPAPTKEVSEVGEEKGGTKDVDLENSIGSEDGKCECCAGEGIKCGISLQWCGGKDCVRTYLYYCSKDNKKAYEFERCKQICLVDPDPETPHYCSIMIDDQFFYPRKKKFSELKKEFKLGVDNLNKTVMGRYKTIVSEVEKSFEVSDKERKAVIEKQEKEEQRLKLKKEKDKKDATNEGASTDTGNTEAAAVTTEAEVVTTGAEAVPTETEAVTTEGEAPPPAET